MNKFKLLLLIIFGSTITTLGQETTCDLNFGELRNVIINEKGAYDTLVFPTEPIPTKFRLLSFSTNKFKLYWNPDFSEWNSDDKSEYSGVECCVIQKGELFMFISTLDSCSQNQIDIAIYDRNIDKIVLKLFYVSGINYAYSTYDYSDDSEVEEQLVLRPLNSSTKDLARIDFCHLFEICNDRRISDHIGVYKRNHKKSTFHRENIY